MSETEMATDPLGIERLLRVRWKLADGSPMRDFFIANGVSDPRTMSSIIVRSYWRHVRGQGAGFEEQVRTYRTGTKWMESQELREHRLAILERLAVVVVFLMIGILGGYSLAMSF